MMTQGVDLFEQNEFDCQTKVKTVLISFVIANLYLGHCTVTKTMSKVNYCAIR